MAKLQNAVPEKLYGLDHLRTLAIALVFFFHYPGMDMPEWVWKLKDFGWIGVDLFFVLSGFLIARQLFTELKTKNSISLKQFFIKRFFRIIPVYLVVVAIYFLIPVFRERESLPALWRFLTFTQNIGLNPSINGTFSHAWSLCIEEQFYLFFPLIIAAAVYFKFTKKAAYIILGFFLFTCLVRLYIWDQYLGPLLEAGNDGNFWVTWIYYPTHTRLDGLLTGISIAGLVVFYPALKDKINKYANFLLLTGIIILTGAYYICQYRVGFNANIFGFPLIAIGFGFMVLAAISPSCVLYKFRSRVTTSIAILSYSIYLIHKAIRHLCFVYFGKMGIDKESYWMFLLSILFTIIGALILRYAIEKPFLKFRDKLLINKVKDDFSGS
ncbi:MAG: acyltransferase [Ferruginibacter sp.]